MSLDDKEQKLLQGTACLTCELCDAPMPSRSLRDREVVCRDGIVRTAIKAGRRCGYKGQVMQSVNGASPIAALRTSI